CTDVPFTPSVVCGVISSLRSELVASFFGGGFSTSFFAHALDATFIGDPSCTGLDGTLPPSRTGVGVCAGVGRDSALYVSRFQLNPIFGLTGLSFGTVVRVGFPSVPPEMAIIGDPSCTRLGP